MPHLMLLMTFVNFWGEKEFQGKKVDDFAPVSPDLT